MRETADLVAAEDIPENRIFPHAAFVMENVETGRRALFFIEMDMATERIVSSITRDRRITLYGRVNETWPPCASECWPPFGSARAFRWVGRLERSP